jgi:hypothetical protein
MVTDFDGYTGGFETSQSFAPAGNVPIVLMYKGTISSSPTDVGIIGITDGGTSLNSIYLNSSKADGSGVQFFGSAYDGYGAFSAQNFDGSQHATISVQNSGVIFNQVNDGGTYLITGSSSDYAFVAQPGLTPYVAGGDVQNLHNNVFFKADDSSSQWTVNGLKQVISPSVQALTYNPIGTPGLNNIVINPAGYTGTGTTSYSVTIDGIAQDMVIVPTSSIVGAYVVGENVTSTSGGNGTLISINTTYDGLNTIFVIGSDTGSFLTGDTLTGSVSSATSLLSDNLFSEDTYTWSDGTTTVNNVPAKITPGARITNNVSSNFLTGIGHTLGDNWTFNVISGNILYGRMEFLDGNNQGQTFGDVDGVSSGDNIYIHQSLTGKHGIFNRLGAGGEFVVSDLGNGGNVILGADSNTFNYNDPSTGNSIISAQANSNQPYIQFGSSSSTNGTYWTQNDNTAGFQAKGNNWQFNTNTGIWLQTTDSAGYISGIYGDTLNNAYMRFSGASGGFFGIEATHTQLGGLQDFANNTAALAGTLVSGDLYYTTATIAYPGLCDVGDQIIKRVA